VDYLRCCRHILILAAGLILVISGTGFASQTADGTSLRGDARVEISHAVAAVAEARRKGALWIPAEKALVIAQAAFARGDYREAISQARVAKRFVELGIKQLDSEPYQHF
jgi:hypothetical protein